jgi:hypothetical protein
MSEPRKDVKVHLDAHVHAALRVICESKDIGLGEYIEQLVAPHVLGLVHDVTVMAEQFRRSGISGERRESPGTAGSAHE